MTESTGGARVGQYATALAIGMAAAIASCALVYCCNMVVFTLFGVEAKWLAALSWCVLSAAAGCVSGRVLCRSVDSTWPLAKVLLATPGVHVMGVLIVVAQAQGQRYVLLAALVGAIVVILPSAVFTAVGFYFSPHFRRPVAAGLCQDFKYDLRGNESGRCPECGTPIPEEQKKELSLP